MASVATDSTMIMTYAAGGEDLRDVIGPHQAAIESEKEISKEHYVATAEASEIDYDEDGRAPTEEEKATLRRVSGPVPWAAYIVCLFEFANMASYYGASSIFSNFIQRPLPKGGNGWGAPPVGSQETAGALGLGLVAANGITTMFSFLAQTIPIGGGLLADTKLGRLKTVWLGTIAGFLGQFLLVVAALPTVIQGGHAIGPFIVGVLVLSFASGFIKPCIVPMIADQNPIKTQRIKTLLTGEKVIEDPAVTVQRLLLLYYWAINLGDFVTLGTSELEKKVGFWVAFLVPGLLYLAMPICMLWVTKRLVTYPPQGSDTLNAFKVSKTLLTKAGVKGYIKGGDEYWNAAKPSHLAATTGKPLSTWSWDDKFVDDLRIMFRACKVFMFLPVWYMADGGLNTILNSMASTTTTDGMPNDLLSTFNPISTCVSIPIYTYLLFPALRKMGINFSPIRRISTGLMIGVLVNLISAILQWKIYESSPCGYYATNCAIGTGVSPISVWALVPIYWIQPMGGILVSVTAYELAYDLTPPHMKGIVISMVFLTSAFSSAIIEICSPAFKDPNLIYPFVGVGACNLIASVLVWYFFDGLGQHDLDLTIDKDVETHHADEEKKLA